MDDSALKAALRKLLAHGDMAQDNKMMAMAKAKKGPQVAEPCPECAMMPEGEKCEACKAKEGGDDEGELAGLLEQGEG